MKLLRFLFRQAPALVGWALIASAASGAAATGILALTNLVLDRPELRSSHRILLSFGGLCLLVPLARTLSSYLMARLGETVVLRQRLEMSRSILATPLRRLEDLKGHRLLVALTNDTQAVANALTTLPIAATNGAIVLGALVYMFWLDPVLFAFFFVALGLGALFYRLAIRAGIVRFRKARKERDLLLEHVRALTEAIPQLKLHAGRQKAFLGSLEAVSQTLRKLAISASTIFAGAASSGQMLFFVVIGAMLFGVSRDTEVPAATITGYILVLLFMMTPLQLFLRTFADLGRAGVSLTHLEELGLALPDPSAWEAEEKPPSIGDSWHHLELDDVTYEYPAASEAEAFVLGPMHLELRPGEIVFLIGGNGSGKTTLAKLLTGLYRPKTGELRLDGRVLEEEAMGSYQQMFSLLPVEFYLFESLLGLDQEELDAKAQEYLVRLELDHKLEVRDGHFSTTDLSRGQRKRLALLTAYLEDRPIFVFDEWAADQDPTFKRVFYRQLLPELKARGKTVLAITHDENYFDAADRILKLREGRLIAADAESLRSV